MHVRVALLGAAAIACLVTGCNDDGRELRPATPDQNGSVSTTSAPATTEPVTDMFDTLPGEPLVTAIAPTLVAPFAADAAIPTPYTCTGTNVSPALSWTNAPDNTVEIAVTMTDLDAPGFVHWAMSAIDPLATSLGEGVVPEFAITSTNSRGTPGYTGPCPPNGETHSYAITVHFLLQQTELADGGPGADLQAFIEGATLSSATVTGVFTGAPA
ncbi:MAG: YbhB/YbcL family Raf kinase inhibitor-like protein [Ilumatobacteraceae bacterium]